MTARLITTTTADAASLPALLCRVGTCTIALPVEHVVEIMRPLPVEPLRDVPSFVLGLAVIRGTAVPVVDGAVLLGRPPGASGRFVALRVGQRRVAMAVDGVVGVRSLTAASLQELPPLVGDASAVVTAMAMLDNRLLVQLRAARILPDEAWAAVETGGGRV